VVPNLKSRAEVTAALTAGLAALVAFSLPYKLGLIAAALIGVLAGLAVDRKEAGRRKDAERRKDAGP
jgi:predicted branched-subunit amino acid permease